MRYLYTILFYLILPGVFLRLFWRSRRLPAYRHRLGERLGFYPRRLEKSIWVHAVSVGEVIAAIPMIKALQARYLHTPILVTTMTPTGAARVKAAFGDSVIHAYLPYDLPGAVARFLKAMKPQVCIIMETELWPNFCAACAKRNIPLCLMNGRLSAKSARQYAYVGSLVRDMLRLFTFIAANGQTDADRFIALGAAKERVVVTGNIKFDLTISTHLIDASVSLRAMLGNNRFVWIAASTHEGEEEIVLAAHKKLRAVCPDALLILVPRHPDRFELIAKLCEQQFLTVRRSQQIPCDERTAVFLGDTMGELLLFYGAADVALVAGSLVPRGGHNVLEPAALSKAILTGPHVFNFAEICDLFFTAEALRKVTDIETLCAALIHLQQHPDERVWMGEKALAVMNNNRGALGRQLELLMGVVTN